MSLKSLLKDLARRLSFKGSGNFWESNYAAGGNSGEGSYGVLAEFKANFLNNFVRENAITSMIEFGCGDGNQLTLAEYPIYTGVDVSATAVEMCRKKLRLDSTKSFVVLSSYDGEHADCSLSLDVIYHLVEDAVFEDYMRRLFSAADRFVVIYSTNHDESYGFGTHVRHRAFSQWISQNCRDWSLDLNIPNPHRPETGNADRSSSSPADFHVYSRNSEVSG